MTTEQPGKPGQPNPEAKGLICPACGCPHLPVLYTRQMYKRIMRVRQCRYCGRTVRSTEKI